MPRIAAFSNFSLNGANGAEPNVSGNFNLGWNFYTSGWKSGGTIFFPTLGMRDVYSGRSTGTGAILFSNDAGGYWVNGTYSESNARSAYINSSGVYPQSWYTRSYGFNICSSKE